MIDGRRVLAIVPARGGSKGVSRKNLQPVGGRPLIAWTIAAARGSRYIDHVILSSDDAEIIGVAEAEGCEAPFVREGRLATDEATSAEVVMDALARTPGYEIFVLLQPTSPLRTAADIDAALDRMIELKASGCVSVSEAVDHPWLVFGQDEGGVLRPFVDPGANVSLRRQDLPPAFVLNGAIYIAEVARFQKSGRFLEPNPAAYVMPAERSLDIDTWDDLERADALLSAEAP